MTDSKETPKVFKETVRVEACYVDGVELEKAIIHLIKKAALVEMGLDMFTPVENLIYVIIKDKIETYLIHLP